MFKKFIERLCRSIFNDEEIIYFNRPYKIKGFDSIKKADEWVSCYNKPMNLVQMCKVSEITEEEAENYMVCSDAGYIFSLKSAYYGKATRALKDAVKKKYCVIYI
jgi:hypothetical protein